ncbi:MAG: SDR family NAD(P)-dependent oxidoreductase [Steroidobacteraceae bacterium]
MDPRGLRAGRARARPAGRHREQRRRGRAVAVPEDQRASLERIMATNLFAAWDISAEAACRLVAAARPGSIINVASVLALGSSPGYASYSASKERWCS